VNGTLYLEKRILKHKMSIRFKNFGVGMVLLPPPGYVYGMVQTNHLGFFYCFSHAVTTKTAYILLPPGILTEHC